MTFEILFLNFKLFDFMFVNFLNFITAKLIELYLLSCDFVFEPNVKDPADSLLGIVCSDVKELSTDVGGLGFGVSVAGA